MAQVMEISPMTPATIPDGGANVSVPEVPGYLRRQGGNTSVFDSIVNMYRNKYARRAGKASGGCCPCQGEGPYDQTPYSEPKQKPAPGLNQPNGPVKPFQTPSNPCDVTREKLARAGLTPEELNDCLRGKSTRSSTTRRSKRKRSAPRRKSRTRKTKSAATVRRYRKALYANQFLPGEQALTGSTDYSQLSTLASGLGYTLSKSKKKRKSKRAGAKGTARTVGNYRLLSNGACYDPRTRKFVKRANCR